MEDVKYKNTEELDDCFLYMEESIEDESNVTYVLRWVVRDYGRLVAGVPYCCHYIRIGNSIHSLNVLKYDTKVRDLLNKRLYRVLLGLTPATSCAKISFVLIGRRNKEIRPEHNGTTGHNPKSFFEFWESHLNRELQDLVALFKVTVAKSLRVSVGIEKSTIRQDFEDLYGNGLFSDVKLCVGEEEFNVHKVVLAARSPVFAAMLQNEMKENAENRIEIVDSNVTAVTELIRYLYAEKTAPLTTDLALDLFELADKYDIPTLKLETTDYLRCNFSVENILDILISANLHDDKQMKREAIEFIANNMWHLLKSPKWKTFRTHLELVDCILAYLS